MIAYIDAHRDRFGVEPICSALQCAPSTYWSAKRRPRCARAIRDEQLCREIARVHAENFAVYGADKVWAQLHREGVPVARCTVERLMRRLGLRGAVRGKRFRTTVSDTAADRPRDLVDLELATLEWVDWFNHRRLFEDHGRIPPAEFEAMFYRQTVSAENAETQTREPA
jgi:putative transposase